MQRLVPTSSLGLAARALSLPFRKFDAPSPPPVPKPSGPGFRPVRQLVPTSSLGLASRALLLPLRKGQISTVTGTPSPSPVSVPAAARPHGLPTVAEDMRGVNQGAWLLTVARTLNRVLSGKFNATTTVTLAPSATSTVLFDSRIGAFSHIMLSPQSASAATALASGSLFIVPTKGQATIYHPSAVNGDQTFSVLIIG